MSAFGGKADISDRRWSIDPTRMTQSRHRPDRNPAVQQCPKSCPIGRLLPRIPHGAGAGVGGGMRGELAVEFGEQRDTISKTKLGTSGGECGVLSRCGAIDDEGARARKRLEHR